MNSGTAERIASIKVEDAFTLEGNKITIINRKGTPAELRGTEVNRVHDEQNALLYEGRGVGYTRV